MEEENYVGKAETEVWLALSPGFTVSKDRAYSVWDTAWRMVIGIFPSSRMLQLDVILFFHCFCLFCFFKVHAPHWIYCWECTFLQKGVPIMQLCDKEHVSVSLMGPSPMDRVNIQNLGTSPSLTLQQKRKKWFWGKSRENSASLRVFPGCWRHPWDHQIPQVQTVWCEMHCFNILCQLSTVPQAMRKLVRKCSLFLCPRCLISACTALLK